MASSVPTAEQLWSWALEDVGPEAAGTVLVPVASFGPPASRGRFMPPGERDVELSPDDLQRVNADADRARVVLPVASLEGDPAALLALMRHHLEYARVLSSAPGTYAFALAVAAALSTPYGTAGRGSAVVYNAIPMMASANAAGARAVAKHLGPQFDRLDDPLFGSLFRTDDPPMSLDGLARAMVVFAAIWPDAVEDVLAERLQRVDEALGQVGPEAAGWWGTVLGDETFRAMGHGAATFRPTPEEKHVFGDFPAKAWWLVYALIARATRYGLALTTATLPLERAP